MENENMMACHKANDNEANNVIDNDNNGTIFEQEPVDEEEEEDEADLTNLAWLTELRNQRHKAWHNGLRNLHKNITTTAATTTTTTTTIALAKQNQANHLDNDVYYEDDDDDDDNDDYYNLAAAKPIIKATCLMPKNGAATFRTIPTKCQLQQQSHIDITPNKRPMKRPTPVERFDLFCKKIKKDFEEYEKSAEHYQSVECEKPPFNYSHIIGMAMLEEGRVTLQQICTWIEMKFAYFRSRKKWNNSIRHNLSLHPCFRKIERKKYEKGKGGYWELGIDLKKCDRKRIRHRKSANIKQQQQQQHQQLENIPQQKQQQEHEMEEVEEEEQGEDINGDGNMCQMNDNDDENIDDYYHEIIIEQRDDIVDNNNDIIEENIMDEIEEQELALQAICMNLVRNEDANNNDEHNLLIDDDDDMDVQHNVNISSSTTATTCNHYKNHINNIELEQQQQLQQQQEYQLGTIIITTNQQQQQHGTEEEGDKDGTTTIANNNNNTLNCFLGIHPQQQRQQPNSLQDFLINQINTDDIIIECEDNDQPQQQHRGPNVIVEHIQHVQTQPQPQQQQHYSLINNYHVATLLSPLSNNNNNNSDSTTTNNINNNIILNNNENIYHTTEIDSIEEAFQYLRSLDHFNRDDTLLDHLFDVSVSDF